MILRFLGSPVVALLLGLFAAFPLLPNYSEETLTGWIGDSLKDVWRKLDDGNNHFGGERKKLSDVKDFSFYVIEHNGKNTG